MSTARSSRMVPRHLSHTVIIKTLTRSEEGSYRSEVLDNAGKGPQGVTQP